jgi:hypothetical protein
VKQSGESADFIYFWGTSPVDVNSVSTLDTPGDEETSPVESGPVRPVVTGTPDADAGESISKDDLFHLLQNSRRRAVLRYLRGREGPTQMREVAEQVAAWEHDTTVSGLSSNERQRVYVALYQSHLDTLADAGVLEYDKSRGIVEPRPLLDRVAAYTDRPVPTEDALVAGAFGGAVGERTDREDGAEDHHGDADRPREADGRDRNGHSGGTLSDPWDRRYLGVSAAGTVLLALTVLDVAVFGTLSGVAVCVLVLLAFSALTVTKTLIDDGAGRNGTGVEG